MQRKTLVQACALALGMVAGGAAQAQAVAAFDVPQLTVYVSGASAPDAFLQSIATGLFQPGFFSYQDDGGTPTILTDDGRSYRAFFGRMQTGADIPASLRGRTVMFIKRSRGGSVWGVNPIARAQRQTVMNITAGTCALDGAIYKCGERGIDPGLPGYFDPSNAGLVADFGVSDVEPAVFKGPFNVEFGQSELTGAEVARMRVRAANTLAMGLVATNEVPSTTVLSRSDYGSMLNGVTTDWAAIDPSIASGNTQVVVCRRVQGSGTQSAYNHFFSNFPCQSAFQGNVPPARMADSAGFNVGGTGTQLDPIQIDPTAGFTVVENPSSGNVRDCLARAQSRTAHTFRGDDGLWYTVQFQNSTDPFRAIGTLSHDSAANATVANGYTFRYLDGAGSFNIVSGALISGPGTGIAPSKQNLIDGRWDFTAELTFQNRGVAVVNDHGDNIPALAGDKLTFFTEFVRRAGAPAFNAPNWVAALPTNFDPTLPANVGRTAKFTRSGNTCAPLQRFF
ncbi:MAG: hypothetical protein MUF30_01085 [Burkholderiales bacterium]|jgi:hypothetical protein|nr:hypothetical protein [Burkholderiales bacterium]